MNTFKCDCGFEWDEGNNGHHICSRFYMEKVDKLQQENKALKAENAKLNTVVCQTCHGAGSVCSAPDDCYDCPECIASINKIKADAVRNVPFPVVIRKMWSGGEVREMLDNHASSLINNKEVK